jgi:hypothetical protein
MTFLATAKLEDSVNSTSQLQAPDDVRWRALARLYARRTAVDNLISALERYQQQQSRMRAKCASVSASAMLS